MTIGTPAAGWHPDPRFEPPPARMAVSGVFLRTFLYGLVIAAVTGAASGTAGIPVLGTVLGPFVGLALGLPVALLTATVIAISARSSVTPRSYRRCIDVTMAVLVLATAAVAAVWINQRALVGPWPALTMLAVVVVCLLVVRPLLRRLVPPAP
ncbi:hypothetical protein [Mycolicibacterium sp. XJ1819]